MLCWQCLWLYPKGQEGSFPVETLTPGLDSISSDLIVAKCMVSFSTGVVLVRIFRAMKFQSHMHFTDSSELLCYKPVSLQLLIYSGRKQNQQKKIHPPPQIVGFAHSRFRELSKFSVLLTYSLQCLLINAELFHQIVNS